MPSNKIQADDDQLARIQTAFMAESDRARRTRLALSTCLEALRGGDWQGKGADRFYAEMDRAVLPTLQRLIDAFDTAARATGQVRQTMRQAAQDASAALRGEAGGAALEGAGAGASGAIGATGGGGGASGGAASSSSAQPGQRDNPLLARDPNGLFSDKAMRGLIDTDFQGADSAALRDAMKALAGNPKGADLERALRDLAAARGRPYEDIRAEYDRFVSARDQAARIGAQKGVEPPPPLAGYHPQFMGSLSQMRYGSVVGQAFGIDPAFGALLNPSGGLVGPGNAAFDADGSAVGYHGIVHDAAGYLYNYHNAGPGYDYMGREGRDTSSPLSGQREGIAYWRDAVGGFNPGSAASEWIMRGVVGGIDLGSSTIDKIKRVL